jgi:hypothetical protein
MLGTRDPQRGIFDSAARFSLDLDRLGFYGQLAREGHRIFRDSDFRSCYSKVGRPSVPPSQLALARLLQHYEGISDDDVIDRLRYDLRWKTALDLDPLSIATPFVKATFQGFRVRLTLHAKEGLAFERSVRQSREAGLLPKKVCTALDSSPVRGRGAVKDTFNLLSDAIRAVVRAIAAKNEREPEEEAARLKLERHFKAPSIKGSETVEWNNDDEVTAFLGGLLEDCEAAARAAKKAKCASDELALLEKVIEADIDQSGDEPTIRDGVAKDRLVSVSDSEMRHGHKSNGKIYSGHKAHVAVDTESGIVTAIDMTAPGEPDGSKVGALIQQTEKLTGATVEKAVADCAYSSREAIAQAESKEVELTTKMPAPPAGHLGPGDFKVSNDGLTARCPAGHLSTRQSRAGENAVHHWSRELCDNCPLRDQCLGHTRKTHTKRPRPNGRALTVTPDFHERRQRERKARSKSGRALLKRRMAAEHAIGWIKNLGAGVSRYFGRAKTKAQWLWTGAVVNLLLIAEAARERDELAGAAA